METPKMVLLVLKTKRTPGTGKLCISAAAQRRKTGDEKPAQRSATWWASSHGKGGELKYKYQKRAHWGSGSIQKNTTEEKRIVPPL